MFNFSDALLTWYDQHGRHDLPWQVADDPYKVWVSEIMLQQTQVKTVLQYFDRFISRFPTVEDLGHATWEEVAPFWAGLGYYARARNLHKAAGIVAAQGHFPASLDEWMALPGIGRSTAGAMMSLGLRQYGVILDGNVKRVLARVFAIQDDLSKPVHERQAWQLAEQLCPRERNHDYTQAIMDLGATICTPKKPLCLYCPMQANCQAYAQGLVDELPVKKVKKAVPTREGHVLVLQHEAEWLWQVRDTTGLWGGLLCLPIFETSLELYQVAEQFDLADSIQEAEISHSFTHFTWQLRAYMFHVKPQQLAELQQHYAGQWLSPSQAQAAGIPTAMQKLIAKFA